MKKVLILGSTGSIGENTCIVCNNFKDDFSITGLSTNLRHDVLLRQVNSFYNIESVYIEDSSAKESFIKENKKRNIKIYSKEEGLVRFVEDSDFDILVNALTGFKGLLPTIAAIKKGKTVAIANKETLVAGGDIVMDLASRYSVDIIPIDSEHSAIFQIIRHLKNVEVEKVILTASGGPFREYPLEDFNKITLEEALKHPTWSMGKKITIDSATMMNKGFEVIEAHYLFNLAYSKIDTIIHPQSIVHSFVEFVDNEIYGQLGVANMCLPIQNALTYPAVKKSPFEKLDLTKHGTLNFYKMDYERFPLLKLAYKYGELGCIKTCILNATNEICVEAFLNREIKFIDIANIVEAICESIENTTPTIENILEVDNYTRVKTREYIKSHIYR